MKIAQEQAIERDISEGDAAKSTIDGVRRFNFNYEPWSWAAPPSLRVPYRGHSLSPVYEADSSGFSSERLL